ncbi:MAG: hypothetical protein M3162_01620 [Thermoproteota archaeon]|nr:hypothetical protein [Thermoproteota archaeon]
MQSDSKKGLKCHPVRFVNALEEYKARNRELFGIKEIDRFLSFSEKKNICIVDSSYSKSSSIYSIIAQFCIDYCRDIDRNKEEEEENKTILIDAGNGNNLGYVYISLVNNAIKTEVNVRKILDRTMITRAFTFQQLANIVLKEMPTLIQKMDCNIQVIVMGLLETLASSSSSSSSSMILSPNQNESGSTDGLLGSNIDFEPTVNLLDEIVDQLIEFSDKHFVIVHYNARRNLNLRESFIPSKFNNSIELIENDDTANSKGYGKIRIIQKTRSNMPSERLLSRDNMLIH